MVITILTRAAQALVGINFLKVSNNYPFMAKSKHVLIVGLVLLLAPYFASASSIKGTSLGEISGCDYYAIEDSLGDYTVAEWYGGITPYAGDTVVGDLHSYGFKDLYDITIDSESRAWLDDWMLSEDEAMDKLVDECGWSSELKYYFDGGRYYSSYAPSYTPTYSAPKTCPSNAHLNSDSSCSCNAGYTPDSSKTYCVIAPQPTPTPAVASTNVPDPIQTCENILGPQGIVAGQNSCGCAAGYQLNSAQTSCIEITQPVATPVQPAVVTPVYKAQENRTVITSNKSKVKLQPAATTTAATSTSAVPVKKSFWQRVIDWFNSTK